MKGSDPGRVPDGNTQEGVAALSLGLPPAWALGDYPTIHLKITHAGLLTIKRPGVNHLRQF